MSNIYISEPPTSGKVCLVTTAGDIDIELWSRETPKACRNFVQLCMEGYYDETIFHRLVKGFIVQGGDPTGTGQGGQSIYGHPFKDEYHQRLKFVRRGLVAMANAGSDDNGSQFFFTLGSTLELQNKHTIFGKVVGDTLYNMIKLEDSPIEGDRPLYPHKIIKTKILNNPFDDIIPRQIKKKSSKSKSKSKSNSVATKNFSLLSFGEEAEEEEDEIVSINKKFSGKGKSSHDLLKNDPKLSKEALILPKKRPEDSSDDDKLDSDSDLKADVKESSDIDQDDDNDNEGKQDLKNVVQNKLKKSKETSSSKSKSKKDKKASDDDDIEEDYLGKGDDDKRKKELLKIKEEMRQLKHEMKSKERLKAEEKMKKEAAEQEAEKKKEKLEENTLIKSFFEEQKKYREKLGQTKKDKGDREAQTLKLLAKFQQKLHKEKEIAEERHQDAVVKDDDVKEVDDNDDPSDLSWLSKPLENKEEVPILAKDANLKSDDWFDIHDPRASVNKRRRNSPSLKDPSKKYRPSRVTD